MSKKCKAAILSALLLGASHSRADNDGLSGQSLPTMQNSAQSRAASHIDYLGNNFLVVKEKPVSLDFAVRNGMVEMQGKTSAEIENAPSGLHWVPGAQHPALELRLSDQAAIRLHPSRHGAVATAAWSF